MDRTNDFWMPFSEKVDLGTDALYTVLKITPNFFDDLAECPLGDNLKVMTEWEAEYWKPSAFLGLIAKNYLKHGLHLLGLTTEAMQDYVTHKYYDLGNDIGQMLHYILTPEDEKDDKKSKKIHTIKKNSS